MTYYLDSNILIFVLRGTNEGLAEKICSLRYDDIRIPSVVVAELIEGAYASNDSERNMEKTTEFSFVIYGPFCLAVVKRVIKMMMVRCLKPHVEDRRRRQNAGNFLSA